MTPVGIEIPPVSSTAPTVVGRIPSLDGLRAISILAVLSAHSITRVPVFISPRIGTYVGILGTVGVKSFFVMSGFLITSLLWDELKKSGTLSLKRFYTRRALRIFPALYLFLIVMAITHGPSGKVTLRNFLAAAMWVSNYVSGSWTLGHTWSLSVEEQFYLLWPAALLISGRRYAWIFPVALISMGPIARLIWFQIDGLSNSIYHFECVADSLAVGCLIGLYQNSIQSAILRFIPTRPFAVFLTLTAVLIPAANIYSRHALFAATVGIPLLNCAIGLAIVSAIAWPPNWLNWAPLVCLGKISYSLYLWQQPWAKTSIIGPLWPIGALLCACASYCFVEQPILRWRDSKRSRWMTTRPKLA